MKLFVSCILVTLLLGAVRASEPDDGDDERIVGGQIIHISQAPYNVQIRTYYANTFCGGALISSQYVLTAAHCMEKVTAEDLIVVGGANLMSDYGVQLEVERVTIHPGYSKNIRHSDAAILKLKSPMLGKYIKTVNLCSRPVKEGDSVFVTGWGNTADEGYMSNKLRAVSLPVRSHQSCWNEFGYSVKRNMFCGGGFDKKAHCYGDSGGPGLVNGELCGIVSAGRRCGGVNFQSSFADVYAIRSFIEKNTRY